MAMSWCLYNLFYYSWKKNQQNKIKMRIDPTYYVHLTSVQYLDMPASNLSMLYIIYLHGVSNTLRCACVWLHEAEHVSSVCTCQFDGCVSFYRQEGQVLYVPHLDPLILVLNVKVPVLFNLAPVAPLIDHLEVMNKRKGRPLSKEGNCGTIVTITKAKLLGL